MLWSTVVNLAIAVVALSPAFLAVRQLVNPREEPAVSWWRLTGPAVLGIAVGSAVALVWHTVQHSDCGDPTWGCLGLAILAIIVGIPLTAILGCVILWAARTPRPWLTGLAGLLTGFVLLSAYAATTYDYEMAGLAYVICFFAGYLLASLAIGPFLAPKLRLAVYAGVVVVALAPALVHIR